MMTCDLLLVTFRLRGDCFKSKEKLHILLFFTKKKKKTDVLREEVTTINDRVGEGGGLLWSASGTHLAWD